MSIDKNCAYVVKQKRILLLSNDNLEKLDVVFDLFKKVYKMNITQYSLQKLSSMIINSEVDIVMIELQEHHNEIFDILDRLKVSVPNLIIITILKDGYYDDRVVNNSNNVITDKISIELLQQKLYRCLRDAVALKQMYSNNVQSYNDTHELEVMYLCESLDSIYSAIDRGDLSLEYFKNLSVNLSKIEVIFQEYVITSQRIQYIISEFTTFMDTFEIEDVSIEALDGFEHLARVIEGISIFLKKYFLEREFDDIYIVEDSLENSINSMKAKFERRVL